MGFEGPSFEGSDGRTGCDGDDCPVLEGFRGICASGEALSGDV